MTHVQSLPSRPTPRVTFSSLVDVLTSPAHRLPTILGPQKYPKPGPVFGYKKATEMLCAWLAGGTVPDLGDPSLRDHELAALQEIPNTSEALLPAGTKSCSYPSAEPTWVVEGVEISFFPDLLIQGTVGKKASPATGALKLYLRKEPTVVGPTMAALLYFHRAQIVGDHLADPSLCCVTDVQAGIVHTATGNYSRLVKQVEQACQVISSVWPTI